jgi:hypothetical protein
MRFMMIIKATPDSESGRMPSESELNEMGKYNEALVQAGVLVDGGGLHPSSAGVRVEVVGGERTVTDGPFAETKELISGFWMIQVKDKAEAVEWAKRVPGKNVSLELRRLFEMSDFIEGGVSPDNEALKKEPELAAEIHRQHGTKPHL